MPTALTKKEQTRNRILSAAANAFRRDGYHFTGVDKVMSDAGLTAGGFYSHFKNKEDLFAQAMQYGFDEVASRRREWTRDLSGPAWVVTAFDTYLSLEHARAVEQGCPLPALLPEAARADDSVRSETIKAVDHWSKEICRQLDGKIDRGTSDSLIAMAAGAIEMARAMKNNHRAKELLRATRENIKQLVYSYTNA